jgi:hypothetical protein
MAKFNTLPNQNSGLSSENRSLDQATKQINNLFNLNSFNELKKDQTNINIFKNSSFDSNFNALAGCCFATTRLQSLVGESFGPSTYLSHYPKAGAATNQSSNLTGVPQTKRELLPSIRKASSLLSKTKKASNLRQVGLDYPKISAILRAIRSIRLNRDEWKLTLALLPLQGYEQRFASLRARVKNINLSLALRSTLSRASAPASPSYLYSQKSPSLRLPSTARLAKASEASNNRRLENKKASSLRFSAFLEKEKTLLIQQKSCNKIYTYNNIISKNLLLRNMKYNFLKSTLSSWSLDQLKKKIRRISEVLYSVEKPIKNYVLFSYLKNCIFTPPHIAPPSCVRNSKLTPPTRVSAPIKSLPLVGSCEATTKGRSKLSLNKYKGRKFGSFINYNKIIGFKFNSTFYQAAVGAIGPWTKPNCPKRGSFVQLPLVTPCQRQTQLLPSIRKASNCDWRSQPKASWQSVPQGNNWLLHNPSASNRYIKDTYKLLFYFFKSMYCLISKPVLNYTNDKVTIQLFYYLNIPKKKIFRLFSISYIKSIKKKWLAQSTTAHSSLFSKLNLQSPRTKFPFGPLKGLPAFGLKRATMAGRDLPSVDLPSATYNTKLNIRWKLRKAISRLKNSAVEISKLNLLGTRTKFPSSLSDLRNKTKTETLLSQVRPPSGIDNRYLLDTRPKTGINLLFLLRKFNISKVYQNKFKIICAILSKMFNKPVELQLIRLHHPYHDSNILVNLLSLNIKNKRKKARVAIQKIYNKKPVKNLNLVQGPKGKVPLMPAFLSGLNIKIAGRLMGEPIIPRITTKNFGIGASATGKVNYLDVARITKKNRKGAYTIKITSGQNFF